MYIEASSPRKLGDNAKLSITLPVPRGSCLMFYYHMFGKSAGTLRVQARGSTVFQMRGDKGNRWMKADIRLQVFGSLEVLFSAQMQDVFFFERIKVLPLGSPHNRCELI